jgi:anti-sigma-K factor RskA
VENIKAYIETGILELYVLGDISQDEKLQVEAMAFKYPEIKAEIAEIERAFEAYANQSSIEPSEHLRERILNSLLTNFSNDSTFPTKTFENNQAGGNSEAKVVELPSAKANTFYKYAFAASLAALIASLFAIYSLNNRLQESSAQIASLQSQKQQFANQVNYLHDEVNVFHDSAFKFVKLAGTPKSPSSKMLVAWNPIKKKVMIDLQGMDLAENDKAHQYQLWAIVGGKPVDLGVFDAKADTTGMKEMKDVANAQAFAVTLEKRGGSVNPTMDQMVVMGTKI